MDYSFRQNEVKTNMSTPAEATLDIANLVDVVSASLNNKFVAMIGMLNL